jgi:hypothetical protein
MKRTISILFFILSSYSTLHSQMDSLWRGIYVIDAFSKIPFNTLRDSLHLNVVEGSTGYGHAPSEDNLFLTNAAGLRLIHQPEVLDTLSSAQRMAYEAERRKPLTGEEDLWNYFDSTHADIQPDSIGRVLFAPGTAGYMVKSAVPDSEYHYKRGVWLATFRLKIEGTYAPNQWVVRCEVFDKTQGTYLVKDSLRANRFTNGVYTEFVDTFRLDPPPTFSLQSGVLTGQNLNATTPPKIDLRVYWYGTVTTYLDKITVEDTLARGLFAGRYDAIIKQTAAQYANAGNYPLHDKFYLKDEPYMGANLAFNYVSNRMKDTLGWNNPRALSVTASNAHHERFLNEVRPRVLMVDPYFITSYIPHPSITDKTTSDNSGIVWNTSPNDPAWEYEAYRFRLQGTLDTQLPTVFTQTAELAKRDTIPWIYIPQLHGIAWQTTQKYWKTDISGDAKYDLRPPSASELRLMYNIGIAYGAKGFLAWPYHTGWTEWYPGEYTKMPALVSEDTTGGYIHHHTNTDNLWGTTIWTGYAEKWNEFAALNARLAHIGNTLFGLQ